MFNMFRLCRRRPLAAKQACALDLGGIKTGGEGSHLVEATELLQQHALQLQSTPGGLQQAHRLEKGSEFRLPSTLLYMDYDWMPCN